MKIMNNCNLCPRKCRVNRTVTSGFCGATDKIVVAKAMLHKWEEPCISVTNGAGTVFFSGCNLHCCFCQNSKISNKMYGIEITPKRLSEIFLNLQYQGADNIELVTPTHYVPLIIRSLDIAKPHLNIPVVYNTGGYELPETIETLKDYVDVYLPDLKFYSSEVSMRYSNAPDYFHYASNAILKMIDQSNELKYAENGKLLKGTIIRHMVLPGLRHDSMKILDWISENTSSKKVLTSIMCQYTPFNFIPDKYSEIKRRVTKMEYKSVIEHSIKLGLSGFTQQQSSSSEEYVPEFDLKGII